jgi:sugar phosphate permease
MSETTALLIYDMKHNPEDRKLLRKLDWHLIPIMTLLYLMSFLDRVNIGQAKLDGLTVSLKLSSDQYNICLSAFFITYVVFEIPSNLILKRLRPSRWLSMIMVAWGIVMTLMGLVKSYEELLACRLVLGAAESGLFPGIERESVS